MTLTCFRHVQQTWVSPLPPFSPTLMLLSTVLTPMLVVVLVWNVWSCFSWV